MATSNKEKNWQLTALCIAACVSPLITVLSAALLSEKAEVSSKTSLPSFCVVPNTGFTLTKKPT